MIVFFVLSYNFVHDVILSLSVLAGICINVSKFYFFLQDRKEKDEQGRMIERWRNHSKYFPKKPKK